MTQHGVVLAGERRGRLVATAPRLRGEKHVACMCDCGTEHLVLFSNWKKTKSCGCLAREVSKKNGRAVGGHNRCLDPAHERGELFPGGPIRCRTCHLGSMRKVHSRLRAGVLEAYGRLCACCGEWREVFLTLDHIDGGGGAHRRELGGAGRRGTSNTKLYRWLRNNGYPAGFRILCFNCNSGRHINGGECPHETERREAVELAGQPDGVL